MLAARAIVSRACSLEIPTPVAWKFLAERNHAEMEGVGVPYQGPPGCRATRQSVGMKSDRLARSWYRHRALAAGNSIPTSTASESQSRRPRKRHAPDRAPTLLQLVFFR